MLPRWHRSIIAVVGLAGMSLPLTPGAERAAYSSIAPATAVHGAVESNLTLVRQWLSDKDYASAADATNGLATLAQLYGYQSDDPDWRKRSAALQEACSRLADAVERKSRADSDNAVAECARLLGEMAQNPPTGSRRVEKNFKPFGSSKTWMQLMDGAYVDAKRAETTKELEQRALAIAEEVHVVGFLREDSKWRASAAEVSAAALRAARLAKEKDLAAARRALKEVHHRCEACHEHSRR
jgi:hypothetical protein